MPKNSYLKDKAVRWLPELSLVDFIEIYRALLKHVIKKRKNIPHGYLAQMKYFLHNCHVKCYYFPLNGFNYFERFFYFFRIYYCFNSIVAGPHSIFLERYNKLK